MLLVVCQKKKKNMCQIFFILLGLLFRISREIKPIGCLFFSHSERKIYYKELAHVVMEVYKSQKLQLASCRPRRATVLFKLEAQWPQDPGGADVSVQIWRQKKTDAFTQRQSGRRKFLILAGGSVFCFIQAFNLNMWGPPTLMREISFTQSTYSNVNLIQNTLTDIMGDQRPRHPVQWKYKINYCTR